MPLYMNRRRQVIDACATSAGAILSRMWVDGEPHGVQVLPVVFFLLSAALIRATEGQVRQVAKTANILGSW